jgi:DNA-directed RNA polymerase subunit RPC12/RpoP
MLVGVEIDMQPFGYKCPACGTHGKLWNKEPEAFVCPKCSTFFSQFGVVLEPEEETDELWT